MPSALGWLGSTLRLKRLAEENARTPRQRRRTRRKLGSFPVAAVLWVGALLQGVGVLVSVVEGC